MHEKIEQLKAQLAEWHDLYAAAAVLEWDQQVMAPEGGARSRSYQLSTLRRMAHERLSSPELGQLLEDLKPVAAELDPESDEARLVVVTTRRYNKNTKVPAALVGEFFRLTAEAHGVWREARAENNFAKFQPYLERIFDLRKQYADFFAPYEHVYDALLDDFEPEMKTADVKAIFDGIRPRQVELIRQITARPQVDDKFLYQPFDEQKQWNFGVEAVTKVGYEWHHGRLDKTAHPFSINFGNDDVRITTRVDPNFFNPYFFATLHETGHALYERGSGDNLERTPLAGGATFAMHESQSRTWENLVGRSLPFWEHFYPRLQSVYPSELGGVSLEQFYKGINIVKPSLIRVEADEATYNLHIMLRMEIEIGVLEGAFEVKDLPEIWRARMQEYLGLTPPDDANGVLQDVHWSSGYIGYFPTYALGNIISAQLWDQIMKDIPDVYDQMRRGKFDDLLGWQREKIHRHGARHTAQTMVERITGSKISPEPYLRYLSEKYGQIYGF